jgi:replicative DNA helicase
VHDVILVKKLSNKTLFNRLTPHIKEYAVSKETWKVLQVMKNYFRSYPDTEDVVWGDFITFFMMVGKLKEDEHALYTTYFKRVVDEDVSSVMVDDVLKNYVTKDYATQVLNKAMNVIQDKDGDSLDDVTTIMSAYHKEMGVVVTKDDLFVPTGLSHTLRACGSKGYEWRLEELNVGAGPLRDGDFVVLAARPEAGKTTFIASELSHFATQLTDDSRPIVWVNNEEGGAKVMNRVIQAHFGTTLSDMLEHEKEYDERYKKEVGNRIRIINDDMGLNDVRKLSALFDEVNPSMIVFDQLDKVDGFGREAREDLRLGKLYEWARDLAKKFGPTIAVSQASESADYVNYITLSMLRGSKTDKAGEADLIITLGKDKEDDYKRYLHLPKNKLWGGVRSKEVHRHGKFEVRIRPEIARYEGVF